MTFKILLPSPGESISHVQVNSWLKQDGEYVNKGEKILEIESEKASLTVVAEESGVLSIRIKEGEEAEVGEIAGTLDTEAKADFLNSQENIVKKLKPVSEVKEKPKNTRVLSEEKLEEKIQPPDEKVVNVVLPSPGESIVEVTIGQWLKKNGDVVSKNDEILEIESEKASLTVVAEENGVLETIAAEDATLEVGSLVARIYVNGRGTELLTPPKGKKSMSSEKPMASVAAAKMIREEGINPAELSPSGKGGRVTKGDVLTYQSSSREAKLVSLLPKETSAENTTPALTQPSNALVKEENKTRKIHGSVEINKAVAQTEGLEGRLQTRNKMSLLRKNLARRLVAVKNETAMLTTFNEIDMSAIMDTRKKYKEAFREQHEVNLGFMSFFTKACALALTEFPLVNAQVEEKEVVYFNYVDMGIAVSAPRGLVVPVIRNAEKLSLAQIEQEVLRLAKKARENKLSLDEMTGGTFTITNGGVFGSMLSTPIINPPQSAILGMHNIVQRPVAIDGSVLIRPIMYLALSYDHRIIDGKDSVSFLVRVKQLLEDPVRMLLT